MSNNGNSDRSAPYVSAAGHEIVSDTTDAMLDWFEALLSPNAVLRPVASLVLPHER